MGVRNLNLYSSADIEAQRAEFNRSLAAELAGAVPELPCFPEVAVRVRRALSHADIGIEEVVRIVSAEPSLSVRLLQLANSAALGSGGARRVTTLQAAIARMGFNLARSATMAFALSQMRRAEAWRGMEQGFRAIWDANARLAAMSHALARHCERNDADQALLAGMLNAVGKLFVLTRLRAFPALHAAPAIAAQIGEAWHARAARLLLLRWDLESELVDAACDFDGPQPQSGFATLADVLRAAHHLVQVQAASRRGEVVFLEAALFKRLGVDVADVNVVLDGSSAEIASLRAALAD